MSVETPPRKDKTWVRSLKRYLRYLRRRYKGGTESQYISGQFVLL